MKEPLDVEVDLNKLVPLEEDCSCKEDFEFIKEMLVGDERGLTPLKDPVIAKLQALSKTHF